MELWQRLLLYFLLAMAVTHYLRDTFDALGIKNRLTTILVKENQPKKVKILWAILPTYVYEIAVIVLVLIDLLSNSFGILGYIATGIASIGFILWIVSYYLL